MTTREAVLQAPSSFPDDSWLRRFRSLRRLLAYLGPAFVVSVGYMDPGNWATDLEGGSRFAYRLIWVLLASNLMAIFLQNLSAKLGIATGKTLAEQCRDEYGKATSYFLWGTAELAMIATDLAEFLGSALGIHLLFDIPLLPAVLLTSLDVFLLLALDRFGYRAVEAAIISLVGVVGLGYIIEIVLARPDIPAVLRGTFVPSLDSASLLVAIGMLGATVMPHNLYLHSSLAQNRVQRQDPEHKKEVYRFAMLDSVVALNGAFFVNAAILIMAAATFHHTGLEVASIEEAHRTLTPLLGPLSAFVFALALLASGISSSTTGTLAGQVVMEGFLHLRWRPWVRRVVSRSVTMVPAIIAIASGVDPMKMLVLSQVFLSFQLPFAIIPLVRFTSDRRLMGPFVNRGWVTAIAYAVATLIIGLNVWLLYSVFFGA
ncbi:MAG: Nramp family divalent metal transporter [Bacillota bacterium]